MVCGKDTYIDCLIKKMDFDNLLGNQTHSFGTISKKNVI